MTKFIKLIHPDGGEILLSPELFRGATRIIFNGRECTRVSIKYEFDSQPTAFHATQSPEQILALIEGGKE